MTTSAMCPLASSPFSWPFSVANCRTTVDDQMSEQVADGINDHIKAVQGQKNKEISILFLRLSARHVD